MSHTLTSVPAPVRTLPFVRRSTRRPEKVAVLLNANARSVNARLQKEISRFVPSETVFLSHTLDEAEAIVQSVLDDGYSTLLVGGGDGTFVGLVNAVLNRMEEEEVAYVTDGGAARKAAVRRRMVRFGVLRLGTGNSLAGLTGAADSFTGTVEDILRTRSGDVTATRRINLVRAEGRWAPFAGLGVDAKVLGDYTAVKDFFAPTPLGPLAAGVAGYVVSGVALTFPSLVFAGKAPNVEIINEGAPAQQLGPDGRPIGKPIATGEVIYRGPCRLAGVGTVPAYGFDFTMYPHALRIPGRAQLRVTAMTPAQMLRHARDIWRGRTPGSSVLDFAVENVRVSFDRKMPFQIGGDPHGETTQARFSYDPRPVELLDFRAQA